MEGAGILTGEIPIRVVVLVIVPPVVTIAILADGVCLRFLEAYVGSSGTPAAECKSYMEELDANFWRLFPSPLTHHARPQIGDFEFLPITVPLIVGLKLRSEITGIVDIP